MWLNHLQDQASLTREQIKPKDQQINLLLEHTSKYEDEDFWKNGSLLQPIDLKQINSTIYTTNANNKKTINILFIDDDETFQFANRIMTGTPYANRIAIFQSL